MPMEVLTYGGGTGCHRLKRPVKNWASILESEARAQVEKLADLPFIHSHVAVMPDAHAGKGSTVGTVIATKGAIIPAAVGVDIGCGMAALPLGFDINRLDDKLVQLRAAIEKAVPVGHAGNNEPDGKADHLFGRNKFEDNELEKRARLQCGSLGGGNHFIEVCRDENNQAWIMLHSGSRHVGKALADIHINSAKGLMKRYFIDLPDPDLAYLVEQSPEFEEYLRALNWAQDYARVNREIMVGRVFACVMNALDAKEAVDAMAVMERRPHTQRGLIQCHHNYTARENHFGSNVWVTRKGAVRAREGDLGIVPGSMGTCSYIVEGKGNPQSFHSCSHGAGRRMSRAKARQTFNVAHFHAQTEGVECRKDKALIDEIPGAYKPIETVMADQDDLVAIKHTLKQVLCVKG